MPTNTKPTSSTRSATARANGAKSHGPATPAGRARSSRNATRHGLSATKSLRSLPVEPKGDRALRHGLATRAAALPPMSIVLGGESPADFQRLLDSYLYEFAPTSPIEVELVETMASARWRLRRLANIETTLLTNEMETSVSDLEDFFEDVDREPDVEDHLAYAFKRLADGASLHLLNRYEGTIGRSYARAFKQLQQFQALRNRPQPNEPKKSLQSSPVEPIGDRVEPLGDRVRRRSPIPATKTNDKTSPAPRSLPVEPSATGPFLQTPPQPSQIRLESQQTPIPARQISAPPSQPATMQNSTCK